PGSPSASARHLYTPRRTQYRRPSRRLARAIMPAYADSQTPILVDIPGFFDTVPLYRICDHRKSPGPAHEKENWLLAPGKRTESRLRDRFHRHNMWESAVL